MISNNMLVLNQDGETLNSNVEVIDLRGYNFIKKIKSSGDTNSNSVDININKSYILFCNIDSIATNNGFSITQSNNIILQYEPNLSSSSSAYYLPIVIKFSTSIENCKFIPIDSYNNRSGTVSVFESI